MSRCTEYEPTITELAGGARHVVASEGADGFWTLCGRFVLRRKARVVSRNPEAGTVRIGVRVRQVETWEVSECCRACREEHLRAKQRRPAGWWRSHYAPEEGATK